MGPQRAAVGRSVGSCGGAHTDDLQHGEAAFLLKRGELC